MSLYSRSVWELSERGEARPLLQPEQPDRPGPQPQSADRPQEEESHLGPARTGAAQALS
jgi:hypothetical protein